MSSVLFPPAFENRMKKSLGNAWEVFEQAHQLNSPVSIRINPRKEIEFPQATEIPWAGYGRYLPERPVFTLDPAFHAGSYYVQEASSMMLEQVFKQTIDTTQPLIALDLCAAPGGKSTHILSLLNSNSLLVSNEVIKSRANILSENIQKWGHCNVVVTNNDPEDFQRVKGFFDVIVVDAPCSGEGLFRKDPMAMQEWSESNAMICSRRQKRVLEDVWPSLKENGILIYSTCTYNPDENEENLKWLQENHTVEFLSIQTAPAWGVEEIEMDSIRAYRCSPHRVKGEGFFISIIRKKGPEHAWHLKNSKSNFQQPSKKVREQLDHWITEPKNKTFIQREDLVQFFLSEHAPMVEHLSRNLRLVTAGTFTATLKHDKLVPEHAFALSTEINPDAFYKLMLSRDEALQYLRKETLVKESDHKGFALVTYQDHALGWANILPNRINNLYPAEWRIRMGQHSS